MMVIVVTLVLAPGALAQSKFKTLHKFTGTDGSSPTAVLVFDAAGNLYGTTWSGGSGQCDIGAAGCGTVFELTLGQRQG